MVGERVRAEQAAGLVALDQGRPVAGGVQRRGGQREVRGVGVVRDQQLVAGVLDVVLDAFAAGRDHDRVTRRVLRVEQPDLAGELAAERDHDRLLVAGQVDADPEPLVRLFHHQHVIGRAEGVPPDLVRAPGVVDLGVEDRRAVGGPGRAVVHLGQLVRQQLAGVEVLDPQREPLVALEVDRVRQQAAVGGDVDGAEREELGVAGHLVAVEHDLFAGDLAVGGRRLVAVHLAPGSASSTAGPRSCGSSTSTRRAGPERSGRSAGSGPRSP